MSLERELQSIRSSLIEELEITIGRDPKIIWNVGLGDGSGLLGSLQHLCEKILNQRIQFDHTIRISVPSVMDPSGSEYETEKNAVLAVANALDLMDEHYKKRKNEADEEKYYSYGERTFEESDLIDDMKRSIYKKIEGKRCLVIVENLLQPLDDPKIKWLTEGWLPLSYKWRQLNWWIISTPSREIVTPSKDLLKTVVDLDNYPPVTLPTVILVEELQWVAHHSIPIFSSYFSSFSSSSFRESRLWSCLLYTQLLSPLAKNYCNNTEAKELIRFWICEGLFTRRIQLKLIPFKRGSYRWLALDLEEPEEEENTMITGTDYDHELFGFAETILGALISSSLLRSSSQPPSPTISFPYPNTSHCVNVFPFSGMWQLLSDISDTEEEEENTSSQNRLGLLTEADISNPTQLTKRNWISLTTDSCKFIAFPNPRKNKTTTLTLRGREDISQPTIEALLSHMPSLCVLDLSYTSIESLPPSLALLTNLRLLSLKHCQNLISLTLDSSNSSPISFLERLEVLDLHGVPLTEIPDDLGNKKCKIFYLDLSCPKITSLPDNIFADMESRLKEVVFLGCESLTNLPSSLVSLKNLETLSVSETKLTNLPPDTFNQMLRLRVLTLINNNLLETLPKSLCEAQNLEEVELNGCRSLVAIDSLPTNKLKVLKLVGNNRMVQLPESLLRAQNLEEVELNGCRSLVAIDSLPTNKLKVLKLIGNNRMVQLPESLLRAQNLEEVELNGCRSLVAIDSLPTNKLKVLKLIGNNRMVELPESLLRSHNLQELKLSDCESLNEIKLTGHVSLKLFSLTQSPTISLSLRGCRELKTVVLQDLHKLEELDLSGTAIRELNPEILGMKRLRKLVVQAASQLRRVPWHQIYRIPEILNIDQCEHIITANGGSNDHGSNNHRAGVRISVKDSLLFYKLQAKNCRRLLDGGSLYSFYILVSSCAKRNEKKSIDPSRPVQPQIGASFIYKNAYYFKDLIDMPHTAQQPRYRHVEISSTEQYPNYLFGFLDITESLSIKDNEHLKSVTDLNTTIPRLKDVLVERCQGMKALFISYDSDVACEVENIRVGHLQQITTLFDVTWYGVAWYREADLFALKHLHVSNCGKLESLFPDSLILPSLETLTITYCDRLRTVFYKSERRRDVNENCLQNLRNIQFQELPHIQHIYEDQRVGALRFPQWKTLHFRGCWSLRQLPLIEGPREQQVCIDGEARQCKKIIAQMKAEQLFHYKFKCSPLVASFKDGVKNIFFLK